MAVLDENIAEVIALYRGRPEMALEALQKIQSHAGYVSDAALNQLAIALGIPAGELLGVISFYSELRAAPPGRHRVCVCHGDSCAAMGAHHIAESVESYLGVAPSQTTPDGQLTYEKVYCLGNCALSPSIAIDEDVQGRCDCDGVVQQLKRFQKIKDA